MLSYRHAFHAGNFADVLKHIVLCECVEHLLKKDKPFAYIDTHAGAGLYSLQSDEAKKLREYQQGVGKLKPEEWPELAGYFAVLKGFNPDERLTTYPGSPFFVLTRLRSIDKAWLYELHPQDFVALKALVTNRQAHVHNSDGLQGLLALLPPTSRRGLILIDPAYEVKTDYALTVETLIKAQRKFPSGTYILWYPVVERKRIIAMEKELLRAAIPDIQQFELGVQDDTHGRGMTSAGVFIINPPWPLFGKMQVLLPRLARALGSGNKPLFKCNLLAEE